MANLDVNLTTELTRITGSDVDAINTELVEAIFPKAYDKLTDLQKQVLLAVGLFDRDASLQALYHVSWVFVVKTWLPHVAHSFYTFICHCDSISKRWLGVILLQYKGEQLFYGGHCSYMHAHAGKPHHISRGDNVELFVPKHSKPVTGPNSRYFHMLLLLIWNVLLCSCVLIFRLSVRQEWVSSSFMSWWKKSLATASGWHSEYLISRWRRLAKL